MVYFPNNIINYFKNRVKNLIPKKINILSNKLIVPATEKLKHVGPEKNILEKSDKLNLGQDRGLQDEKMCVTSFDSVTNTNVLEVPLNKELHDATLHPPELQPLLRRLSKHTSTHTIIDLASDQVENICANSKWRAHKYNRKERRKIKRGKVTNQQLIPSFFSFARDLNSEVAKAIIENDEVGLELIET